MLKRGDPKWPPAARTPVSSLRAGRKGQLVGQGWAEMGSSPSQEWVSSGLRCAANQLWNLGQGVPLSGPQCPHL